MSNIVLPLTPDHGINRVVLYDLPGAPIDEGIRSKTAYDLVGTAALFEQIRARADDLKLPSESVAGLNTGVFIAFDRCFESDDGRVHIAAREIARRFGRNVGYILLALRHPAAQRELRPEWDSWLHQHWWTLARLWIGGGLIRGHLGDRLIEDIQAVFSEAGTIPPELMRDPYGAALPLVGAACCMRQVPDNAVVMDFGSTNVKRGVAEYRDGTLRTLRVLPPFETDWHGSIEDETALRGFRDGFMIPAIAGTLAAVRPDSPQVNISLAAYVDESGQPFARQGAIYAALGRITEGFQQALSEQVSQSLGRRVQINLIHDGTAAAAAHPGDAVMTLGTAIGMGYAPPVPNPLPLARDFAVVMPAAP